MSADNLDRYDVEGMIRDALYVERRVWREKLADVERRLRDELGAERVDRQDAIESIERVLSSRTEHLA